MTALIFSVLTVHALLMLVDEFHFHRLRGLPRWERIGHPIDTLSVLACYAAALSLEPNPISLGIYAGASAVSCLMVTKDEFVHARECQPMEHFLHALLFVLHPIVLGAAGLLWWRGERTLLWGQVALTTGFMVYQVAYWNFVRRPHEQPHRQ